MVIFSGKQTKLIKRIKKEILRVRRKLALQRGHQNSDGDDSVDTGIAYSRMKMENSTFYMKSNDSLQSAYF